MAGKKGRGGRKPILTPELQKKICDAITACASVKDAALINGVGYSTLIHWLQEGTNNERSKYRQFQLEIDEAKARRRVTLKAEIRKHGGKDWRALAFVGATTDGAEFSPKIRVHVEHELGGAIERLKEAFKNEPVQLERALSAIAGRASEPGIIEDESGEGGDDAEGGEALRPTQPIGVSEGVPRP